MKNLGKVAYEAYRHGLMPKFKELQIGDQGSWNLAAEAVRLYLEGKKLKIVHGVTGEEDDYAKALNAIYDKIDAAVGDKPLMAYSAYETVDGIPVDCLDDIAFPGKIQFRRPKSPELFTLAGGEPTDYESNVLTYPTWLELCICVNTMIKTTRDIHHCYFEGFEIIRREDDVTIATFSMGS